MTIRFSRVGALLSSGIAVMTGCYGGYMDGDGEGDPEGWPAEAHEAGDEVGSTPQAISRAGCVYIHYCDWPDPPDAAQRWKTVCERYAGATCSHEHAVAECQGDADAVCGGVQRPAFLDLEAFF